MVAQNMLLNGAINTIQGSTAGDFGFSADGLSVTNVLCAAGAEEGFRL